MKTVSIVFPGQGAQTVGMLAEIAAAFPEVITTYAQASESLGYDLWQLVQQGPAGLLDQTEYTQPALLAGSIALWNVLQTINPLRPAWMAGHSLGEYSALVCAEALSFADAVRLVAARGRLMQQAVPIGQGALAAIIGLEDEVVVALCKTSAKGDEVLAPANFNSPGQIVIAGNTAAVERAIVLAKASGAKMAKLLPVSVPSHCVLMKPAAEQLQALVASTTVKSPLLPVLNNVDVKIYQTADDIRDGLVRQLFMPVRWVETIQFLVKKETTTMIECGPGKVLSSLNKRIAPALEFMNTADLVNLRAVLNDNTLRQPIRA